MAGSDESPKVASPAQQEWREEFSKTYRKVKVRDEHRLAASAFLSGLTVAALAAIPADPWVRDIPWYGWPDRWEQAPPELAALSLAIAAEIHAQGNGWITFGIGTLVFALLFLSLSISVLVAVLSLVALVGILLRSRAMIRAMLR